MNERGLFFGRICWKNDWHNYPPVPPLFALCANISLVIEEFPHFRETADIVNNFFKILIEFVRLNVSLFYKIRSSHEINFSWLVYFIFNSFMILYEKMTMHAVIMINIEKCYFVTNAAIFDVGCLLLSRLFKTQQLLQLFY